MGIRIDPPELKDRRVLIYMSIYTFCGFAVIEFKTFCGFKKS